MPPEPTHRRPFLKAIAGGAVALGAVTAASRVWLAPDDSDVPTAGPSLTLATDGGSDIGSLDIRLGDDLLPQIADGVWRSGGMPTSTHSMVALTWRRGGRAPQVQVRSRAEGSWQRWQRVTLLHDLPDPGSAEDTGVVGTELVWIGDSDGIQVQVAGRRPKDLTLVLLHPAARRADSGVRGRTLGRTAARTGTVARPAYLSRAAWGADESWRDAPTYNTTIEQVHVHHTVSSNTYTEADVPALIRGMYRYHTKNLGWSDLGYNFLVDRFGRTWVGRAGGAARNVRGAHTLGFNATSTGVSAIGNFETTSPTPAMLEAIAALAAWKLSRYARDPNGSVTVVSEGSDKFGRNRSVTLPVVDGHRDTNDTACPGRNLYAALPTVRSRARAIVDGASVTAVSFTTAPTIGGSAAPGGVLTATPGAWSPADAVPAYAWLRNGAPVSGATGPSYTVTPEDLGTQLSVRVDVAKAGLQPASQTLSAPAVLVVPTLVANAKDRRGRAGVRVRLQPPPGVAGPVPGRAVVRLKARRKRLDLVDGRGTAKFSDLRPGTYPVTVEYTGGGVFAPVSVATQVVVR